MNLLPIQASSGPSGAYLAAQALTSINYVSPAGGCFIRRIMNNVRTANGETFVYYADDAAGTYAKVLFHLGNTRPYTQIDICDLWLPVPPAKYILTYGVSSIHDTTFTLAENVKAPTQKTVSAYNISTASGYLPLKCGGVPFQGPAKINRVIYMNTVPNSVGYLYWADDLAGTYANVLRGYSGCAPFSITDSSEDCMIIPPGKYLLAHSEVGSFSCAVTVELPHG